MRCPPCGHENPPGAKFCSECGAAFTLRCPRCQAKLPAKAKFCLECGMPAVQPDAEPEPRTPSAGPLLAPSAGPATPEGERRQLTVLFCDLVGSTPLSQQLDAEDWRDVVTQYQQTVATAVTRFGGHVARFLGDGLLIYFGWPTAREDDPERAIRAGLAILDAMTPLNAKLGADNGTHLAVRIGMHTGPVVIADGGEVFGETPNVAARVQSAAEPDTVVISAATQRLVAGMFVVEDRGPQELKGVRERVVLYRVVQPSGVRSRLVVAAGRLTRFVGREIELATLIDRLEQAQDGKGQNVVVLGEAGVGKSRLVYELHGHLAAVPHTWLECGATPYTEGTPFHPVIALVSQGLAFTPEDTAAEKLAKLEIGLRALTSAENVALLADFLGLPPPTRLQLSPELQRRKTINLLAQWNLALSEVQPLVVVVEDLHWCDVSTLELLGHLIAQSPTARVLLLATARPEFTPPWPAHSNLTTLSLARLTKRQTRDMIAMVAGTDLPAATLDALVARADGVPLYVEELTKAMAEPGAARGVEAIPASLADSLMGRLDRLSAAKEVAQRAAVLGREFGYPLLAATVGMDEAALRHGLDRLVEAEILFGRGEPPLASYTFKHALVQEAAYGSLLKRTRQELHTRVVRALVAQFPERVEAEPEIVARHAEAAKLVDEAVTFYQRAGEQAQARSAHAEAIGRLRKAVEMLATLPEDPQRDARELPLQLALGSSSIAARGWGHTETHAAWERAHRLCESVEDVPQTMRALNGMVSVYSNGGEVDRAVEIAEEILHRAEQAGDDAHRCIGHSVIAGPRYFQGQFASSLAHCDYACAIFDPCRGGVLALEYGTDPRTNALMLAAWNLWQLGYPDRTRERAGESVAAARAVGHPFTVCQALLFQATGHWLRRDQASQRAVAEEVIALSEQQGFPLWHGLARAFRAAASVTSPADTDAVAEILKGLSQAARTGQQLGSASVVALLVEAQERVEAFGPALHAVEGVLVASERSGQRFFDAELHRLKGSVLMVPATGGGLSSESEAEACFRRAVEIARTQEARSFELRAATSLARLWQRQGKRDAARDLLAPLYAWFTEGFDTRDLKDAKALLDDLA